MHGSVSKSGKVRKQTPKVEKKDHIKKTSVGRAKKKKQYQKKYQSLILSDNERKNIKFHPNKQLIA